MPLHAPYSPEGGAENFVGSEAGRILKEGGFADSASLSRILAELLGGTRSSLPEVRATLDTLRASELREIVKGLR